ncbi:fluoride efflux transporter CrcB [soil metagenome]
MEKLGLIFLGGGLGAVARYLVGARTLVMFGSAWPYGTFTVNAVGGLLMGLLIGYLAQRGGADQERWRLLLGVGVLGGFTTFSAFSLETALMIERRAYGTAAGYIGLSVVVSVAAVFAGLLLTRRMLA